MPSKHEWENANAIESIRAVFDSPVLLWVRTRILIHGRARLGDGACPCCGSEKSRIEEQRDDLELLIDRVTGERKLRSAVVDQSGFDALTRVAQEVVIPLRCYRPQLAALLDTTHKVIGCFGGMRSGKTTVAAYWLVRQWMLRGGRGATFWWVSPQRSQTMIGVRKLVTGEFSDRLQPPAFPLDADGRPLLVSSWPETERSSAQRIVMVDGSVIALQHASRPTGANLKGQNVQAIVADEACEIANRPNWTVMLGRLTDSGGSLFAASTPKGGHWLKDDVVDAQKTSDDIHVEHLSIRENPWMSESEVARTIAACRDENEVRREVDGLWVSDAGSLWIHFDLARHTADDPSFNMLRDRQDITAQACRSHWKGSNPYVKGLRTTEASFVLGQDFNISPMSSVVAKVFGDPRRPESWGIYVVDEVQTWNSDTYKHGQWLRSEKVRAGRVLYAGSPIACDSTACNYDPTRVQGSTVHGSSAAKTLTDLGFDARACGLSPKGYPQNPRLLDSISLMHQLMREDRLVIHGTRCPQLLRALTEQQVGQGGLPVKVSNTASDKLSGPIDGLRYLAWALFGDQYMSRKPAQFIRPDG
ncbi:MAG: terminase family protein [Myxococcales bacterium]|nr:terminase family protein [Myxococcales bacterium]